jgi:SAM-dependent methyltransferase
MNQPTAPEFNPHALHKSAQTLANLVEPSDIHTEIATRLISRLDDHKKNFETPLNISADNGALARLYNSDKLSVDSLNFTDLNWPEKAHDLILSNMALPWCADPHQFLLNCGKALKGDGLLLATTFGADTFQEFNMAFHEAGFAPAPHVGPFMDVKDIGQLLSSLKFALPVVDRDIITLTYPSFNHILGDIRFNGGRNLHPARIKHVLTLRQWQRVQSAYEKLFTTGGGLLTLTLEIIYIHGWRPHISQQQPLRPGQYKVKLEEVL